MPSHLVLVKHALPVLNANVPPQLWELGPEGEDQAKRLGRALEPMMPCALVSSPEPKAAATARILGEQLGVDATPLDGLREFDRPVLPLLSAPEHQRLNAAIFENLSRVVLGRESGAGALARFSAAIDTALDAAADASTLVAVAHGTVIALFVGAHNDIDAFGLWTRLQCPSFVVLTVPEFRLARVEENPVG